MAKDVDSLYVDFENGDTIEATGKEIYDPLLTVAKHG